MPSSSSTDFDTSLSGFSRSDLSSWLKGTDPSLDQASTSSTTGNRRRGPTYRSSCWGPDNHILRHLRLLSNRRELAQTSSERTADLCSRICSRPPSSACSVVNGSLTIRGANRSVHRFCLFWAFVGKLDDDRLVGKLPDVSFIELVVNCESWIFACPNKFADRILWCLSSHGCIRDDLKSIVNFETEKEDKIGAGASGTIYTGTLAISGVPGSRPVAIKVLKGENQEKLVVRESSMVAAAGKHPNIICHHGIFQGSEQTSSWYILMDYYAFGDLWCYAAAQKGLEVGRMRPIMRDILSALVHLHQRGILHRDVKPENVLIDEDHSATLCDFGVSCLISDYKAMQTNGFTNAYAAQELRWGTGPVTGTSSDVFGAGATLHYMFTLRYVFSHPDPEKKDAMHRAGILNFADGALIRLPKAWQDLLQNMVCLLPGRLTAAQALAHPALSIARDTSEEQRGEQSDARRPLNEPAAGEPREAEQPQPQSQLCFAPIMPQSQPQAAVGIKGEQPQNDPATSPAEKKKKNSGWYSRLRKLLPKNPFSRGAAKVQPSGYEVVDEVNEAKDEHVK